MRPSICATASCLPTGAPHCSRSAAHSRATFTHHFALAAVVAGW
jgi:hypothetical protein